jgi:pyruvate/2-oxoglutarate dehydrogenase complex dihydrolipoamide acyltransferase (E2) component
MSVRLVVPFVSTNATDVTVGQWRVQPGEVVTRGQVLLDVSTDKAAFDIESPADGILLKTYATARSVLPIGFILALIGDSGEEDSQIERDNADIMAQHLESLGVTPPTASPSLPNTPHDADPAQTLDPAAKANPAATPPATAPTAGTGAGGIRATPKARRLAREHGLDLDQIKAETGAEIITEATLSAYL